MEEILESPTLRSVFSAGHGEVELFELMVAPRWAGQSLAALVDALDCTIVALSRAGRAARPDAGMLLQSGDVLYVGATAGIANALRDRMAGTERQR